MLAAGRRGGGREGGREGGRGGGGREGGRGGGWREGGREKTFMNTTHKHCKPRLHKYNSALIVFLIKLQKPHTPSCVLYQ